METRAGTELLPHKGKEFDACHQFSIFIGMESLLERSWTEGYVMSQEWGLEGENHDLQWRNQAGTT